MITYRHDAREETVEQQDYKLLSDEELTRRAAIDAAAATELMIRLTHSVYALAIELDPLICEDLLQEGLMGALGAVNSFDPEKGSARTYLISCAKNRMYGALKRNSLIGGATDPESELSKVADEGQSHSEQLERLRAAIKTCLTDYEREVVSLYLVGHSYSQIAERLGKDLKSVDNAMQRARKKLRTELQQH